MPSEVAQRYDRKLFDLHGENSGLPLQAYEVAWTGKPKNFNFFLGIGLGVLISGIMIVMTGIALS